MKQQIIDDMRIALEKALMTLTPRERTMVMMRFGFDEPPCTFKSIGEKFGVTTERARQIITKATWKLRHPPHKKRLEEFLGDMDKDEY